MKILNELTNESGRNFSAPETSGGKSLKPLRIWPAIVLIIGMLVAKYLPSLWKDGPAELWMSAAFGPMLLGLVVVLWWLLASRASMVERLLGVLFIGGIAALIISFGLHPSMRGPATLMVTIPMGTAAFAIGAILFARNLTMRRTVIALLLATLGFGFSMLLRSNGIWGDFEPALGWRWIPSAEEVFMSEAENRIAAELTAPDSDLLAAFANPDWAGFRGNDRNSVVSGTEFETDWSVDGPQELWRVRVGPGWSSFAVAGTALFTQEQRGDQECVVCYSTESGAEVWVHEIDSRFSDPLGGPGPRATPTLAGGSLYAMGAEGFLVKLDPTNGELVWQVDIKKTAGVSPPMWGFCASPLVVGNTVITFGAGAGDKGVLAFDVQDGALVWSAPAGRQSYASPHRCTLHGTEYITLLSSVGMHFIDPESGASVSDYKWEQHGYRSLQPYVIDSDSILLATGAGTGTRRVKFDAELKGEEVWTTMALKPDFNDFVVHNGHIFGFDDSVFTCIDLDSGERKWKRGRYGKGQALLLKNSNAVLVISEKGELVLLDANPEKHTELAKLKALEGKTWNHPVIVGDKLYLRNDQEAACYRLPVRSTESTPNTSKVDQSFVPSP